MTSGAACRAPEKWCTLYVITLVYAESHKSLGEMFGNLTIIDAVTVNVGVRPKPTYGDRGRIIRILHTRHLLNKTSTARRRVFIVVLYKLYPKFQVAVVSTLGIRCDSV